MKELEEEKSVILKSLQFPIYSSTSAGGTFRMEDEPDEVYNENFLADLKNGSCLSVSARDSMSADELNRRNSMLPPHLRSTYQAQYQDSNIHEDSLFKVCDRCCCE